MTARPAAYDGIGTAYGSCRGTDARIGQAIAMALHGARTVVNVGAGTGSYEPASTVVAADVSRVMLRQRPRESAPAVQASATRLPFKDAAFAASLAILTIHHWPDLERGLGELTRVAQDRVVVLTWDPQSDDFWLTRDYFPQVAAFDRDIFPTLEQLEQALGDVTIYPLPVPHDCSDGFLGAYWRRPQAYLSPQVRAGMSTFGRVAGVERGVAALRADLESGAWQKRNRELLSQTRRDVGYRLVVARRDDA